MSVEQFRVRESMYGTWVAEAVFAAARLGLANSSPMTSVTSVTSVTLWTTRTALV
jgi:hypothetical protein